MVTQVSYARLYNLGNFENVRFEAVASVDPYVDTAVAYAECVDAVNSAYARWQVERENDWQSSRREAGLNE